MSFVGLFGKRTWLGLGISGSGAAALRHAWCAARCEGGAAVRHDSVVGLWQLRISGVSRRLHGQKGRGRGGTLSDNGGAAVRAAVVRGAGLFAAGGFSKSRPVDHRRGVWRRFSRVCAVPWKKAEKAGQTASACGGKAAQAGGNIICRIVKITKSFT